MNGSGHGPFNERRKPPAGESVSLFPAVLAPSSPEAPVAGTAAPGGLPSSAMLLPTFLRRLSDPGVRHVLVAGCGGGFDFVHGLLLYPELRRLGKRVHFLSHSFAPVTSYSGEAPVVFEEPPVLVRSVTAATGHAVDYAPEVHLCSFLDEREPEGRPHSVFASKARDFAVPVLTRLYRHIVAELSIDAVIVVDGGTDSLVAGDEPGLGDPVEDAVSVQAAAALAEVPLRVLLCAGMGVDRHNGVSDAATLRAVAELTRDGGFLGALAVEPDSDAHRFHADAIRHIGGRQQARSVVSHSIVDATRGYFGRGSRPGRVAPATVFLTPLMALLFAFDVVPVAARSLVGGWIREAPTPEDAYQAFREGRARVRRREEEHLPAAEPWPWAPLLDDGTAPGSPPEDDRI